MKRVVFAASAAALLAACVNVDNSSFAPEPPEPGIAASDLVTARQAQMRMAAITLGSVSRVGADETAEPSKASFAAGGLAKFGQSVPIYFRPDTRLEPDTGALEKIWTDPQGFASAAANFESATTRLAIAASADDRPAFVEALASTKAACKACHDNFRAEDN